MPSDKMARQMELITELAGICEELGWIVAVPASSDPNDEMVPGLVIGTKQFVSEIASVFSDGSNIDDTWETYEKGEEAPLDDQPAMKKKNTIH